MKFFERLFKRKETPKINAKNPTIETKKLGRSKAYDGTLVAVMQDLSWQEQSVLLQVSKPSDVSNVPAGFTIPSDDKTGSVSIWQGFGLEYEGERAVKVAEGVQASVAVSGGRSFFRPAWFADLNKCSGYIFPVSNTGLEGNSFSYRVRNIEVPNAPILFIINDSDPAGQRLFTEPPTVADLAKKLNIEEQFLQSHPVMIVFCHYDLGTVPVREVVDTSSNGKGKADKAKVKEAEKAEAEYLEALKQYTRNLQHPKEVLDAFKWLEEHLVLDSLAVAAQAKAEAEQKQAAQKAALEAAKEEAKSAVAQPQLSATETDDTATTSATAA